MISNFGSTIELVGEACNNDFVKLRWTPYERWDLGIKGYQLEKENSKGKFVLHINILENEFIDNDYFDPEQDEVCYRITAISSENEAWQSHSNKICITYEPVFWLPNSFSPNSDGLNDTFTPLSSGILNDGYQLVIYNRWGEVIFKSDLRKVGWDGMYQFEPAPEGLYFCTITYNYYDKSGTQRRNNAKGSILLIR